MKILEINTVCGKGSTGKIAVDMAEHAQKFGYEVCIAYGRDKTSYPNTYRVGTSKDINIHVALSRVTDRQGCYSRQATIKLLKFMEEFQPNVVHLHNLHGYYINFELLFEYLREKGIPTIWTLHDCWSFTGHCVHFDWVGCDKWKHGCYECPQKRTYPSSYICDNSKRNYLEKRKTFSSLDNLTIITCSKWLERLVKESFLSNKKIQTIHNGIDLNKYHRIEDSDFRKKNRLENKIILLGVADGLDKQKGLYEYIKLAGRLSEEYKVVLVGCDKNISREAPNILALSRTSNLEELLKIYSAADVFVNLTLSDNFPTVNLEALACGLPIITYNTGGSPESIDETCGIVIPQHDIDSVIENLWKARKMSREACLRRSKKFDKSVSFDKYIKLYEKVKNSEVAL